MWRKSKKAKIYKSGPSIWHQPLLAWIFWANSIIHSIFLLPWTIVQGKFGQSWKLILSLKPKRPRPPKLVCIFIWHQSLLAWITVHEAYSIILVKNKYFLPINFWNALLKFCVTKNWAPSGSRDQLWPRPHWSTCTRAGALSFSFNSLLSLLEDNYYTNWDKGLSLLIMIVRSVCIV